MNFSKAFPFPEEELFKHCTDRIGILISQIEVLGIYVITSRYWTETTNICLEKAKSGKLKLNGCHVLEHFV